MNQITTNYSLATYFPYLGNNPQVTENNGNIIVELFTRLVLENLPSPKNLKLKETTVSETFNGDFLNVSFRHNATFVSYNPDNHLDYIRVEVGQNMHNGLAQCNIQLNLMWINPNLETDYKSLNIAQYYHLQNRTLTIVKGGTQLFQRTFPVQGTQNSKCLII